MSNRPSCPYSGKLSYPSERDANLTRTALTTARKSRNGGPKRVSGNLETFKCDVCGSWHLGRPRSANNIKTRKGAEG